jgi:hypothetical protein
MAEPAKLHRELISRGAMLVLALALLYGGWRCVKAGADVGEWVKGNVDEQRRPIARGRAHSNRASIILYVVGGALLLGGGVFGLMAVVPANTFARLMGPPNFSHYDD